MGRYLRLLGSYFIHRAPLGGAIRSDFGHEWFWTGISIGRFAVGVTWFRKNSDDTVIIPAKRLKALRDMSK